MGNHAQTDNDPSVRPSEKHLERADGRRHLGWANWRMIWNDCGLCGIIWDDLGWFGIIWDHLESSGITWDHLRSSGIVWVHLGSPEIRPVSSGIIWGHLWIHLGSLRGTMWQETTEERHPGDFWEGLWQLWHLIGNYHSTTCLQNYEYHRKKMGKYRETIQNNELLKKMN